jgi:hypothetical protein
MNLQELETKKALLTDWINGPRDDAGDVDAWNKHNMLVESWQKSLEMIDAEIERRHEQGEETK